MLQECCDFICIRSRRHLFLSYEYVTALFDIRNPFELHQNATHTEHTHTHASAIVQIICQHFDPFQFIYIIKNLRQQRYAPLFLFLLFSFYLSSYANVKIKKKKK